jgi:hypothetical protein
MGNYFGTCLSVDDCNAFATVANAAEANKRVIYVYADPPTTSRRRGDAAPPRVIGRKLIALTRDGRLIGYRTYGTLPSKETTDAAADPGRQWLKRALDNFCRDLAQRCGAKLAPVTADEEAALVASNKPALALFAKWYDDGPELFGPCD